MGSFNQRARDSSSLERTKGKPTIHRFKCDLDRGFLFVISARRGLKSATEMRQLQRGFVRIPEHLPEDLIKNEWRGGIWRAEGTLNCSEPLSHYGQREKRRRTVQRDTRICPQALPNGQDLLYGHLKPKVVDQHGHAGPVLRTGRAGQRGFAAGHEWHGTGLGYADGRSH